MATPLPLSKAEYSFLDARQGRIGVLVLDPERDALHPRFRDGIEDDVLALWAEEIPDAARELGAASYLALLEDRLSNAVEITDREAGWVRNFPAAADRLYERRVLGIAPASPARAIPLYTLRAAAGKFGEDMEQEPERWIEAPHAIAGGGAYALHIRGRSMEPLVPDGSIAVFRPITGTRQGRRVLVWRRASSESGGEFTLKVYRSRKRTDEEGWQHESITLDPLNPEYEPVVLDAGAEYRVLGEFLAVLALEETM